jgi:hypothetical protein
MPAPSQPSERNEHILGHDVFQAHANPFKPFIRIEQRIAEIEVQFFGHRGALKVPEHRKVTRVFGIGRNVLNLPE